MEGLRADFPEYYNRMVEAVWLCFQQLNTTRGNLTAIVRFEIQKDGRIGSSSIRRYRGSGNGVFDVAAIESVECAGRGMIGPLPPAMGIDILPVELTFRPEENR